MHHPEGILWIQRPGLRPAVYQEKAPLRSLAPTVLSFFGLEKAPHMSGQAIVFGEADQGRPAPQSDPRLSERIRLFPNSSMRISGHDTEAVHDQTE